MPELTTDVRTSSRELKCLELDRLAEHLARLRGEGKKIVLCHGVFDLLHIGHVRYFQRAKQLGDVLVVTVTPDRFVNKGPQRPAFSESLRIEALAALECVDHVALNRWPMAVETIRLLQPHVYVKGPDYKDPDNDHTGGIVLEEAAVKSVNGQLVITDDITFSASHLINRHLPLLSQEATQFLERFSSRYTSAEVLCYLEQARPLKVLVVGEAIIDEYQYCESIGKSSKEPMLAVKRLAMERFAGGTLAVANHVANFCDQPGLITFLGVDDPKETFIREKLNPNVQPRFLYRAGAPTIVKRRFIDQYFFTKFLEVYEINDEAWDPRDHDVLCEELRTQVPNYDVVLAVDFGHEMFSREAIDLVCEKAKFLVVNTQCNAGNLGYHSISKYPRVDYVCLAERELRLEMRDRRGDLKSLIQQIAQRLRCPVTATRGAYGCLSYSEKDGFVEVPAFANQVVDRMGAGDTFLSLAALCVAAKAPLEIVGFIGNVAGAEAVATVGHRTSIERARFFKHIESLLK
ncbi:MAG: adenylyltransferase/cytidyltransferase family protein [Candidatus Omnitrophica bacterium]|nr:adenylyltransferase/cytidyltransferase family protein [Candidatus Omnitrophota bacterium]